MATDYAGIIPRQQAAQLLEQVELTSAVLELGQTLRMSAGLASLPIVSFLPVAGFVNPAYGGRKPATKVEWSAKQVVPEELACVLAIPSAFIDDAGFPVWEQVRTLVGNAIAYAIDDAVLFGQGAPASFPVGGVANAAGAAIVAPDAIAGIDAGAAQVEASGLIPDGIAAGANIGTALRGEYRAQGALPDQVPNASIYGMQVETSPAWDPTVGDAIVGDWSNLLIGIREDITFETSEDAVLQDNTGAIIANAFQDDLVAMRCYIRLGVAIGTPKTAAGQGDAFALVDWTAGAQTARAAGARSRRGKPEGEAA